MVATIRPRWHHLVFFLGPALVLYTLFMAWPLLDSLRLSFYQQQVDGSQVFIGMGNFNKLFGDPQYSERFWGALAHNFQFFAVFMIVQNPVALLLAALLTSQRLKGAAIYRTILFSPTTLSIVIIGWIWTLMLNPLWGIVNDFIKGIGLGSIIPKEGWLGSPSLALTVVALVGVWQYVGLPMILFLAALLGIDDELVDAARFQRLRERLCHAGNASRAGLCHRYHGHVLLPDYVRQFWRAAQSEPGNYHCDHDVPDHTHRRRHVFVHFPAPPDQGLNPATSE